MATSSKMSEQLSAIKRKLGLTLIKFQDAAVELEPFIKRHIFENSQFLLNSIIKHYKEVSSALSPFVFSSWYISGSLGFPSQCTCLSVLGLPLLQKLDYSNLSDTESDYTTQLHTALVVNIVITLGHYDC